MDDTNQKSASRTDFVYRFGLFALDTSAGLLSRNGLRIRLQDQPFQLLALLLERHGEVVAREEIRQRLWESNTFVDFDKSLGVAILKVREALGDSAANPRFLETVPRRGFRFVAPVSVERLSARAQPGSSGDPTGAPTLHQLASDTAAPSPIPARMAGVAPAQTRWRFAWFALAGICAGILLAYAAVRVRTHGPSAETSPPAAVKVTLRRSVAVLGFRNLGGG